MSLGELRSRFKVETLGKDITRSLQQVLRLIIFRSFLHYKFTKLKHLKHREKTAIHGAILFSEQTIRA